MAMLSHLGLFPMRLGMLVAGSGPELSGKRSNRLANSIALSLIVLAAAEGSKGLSFGPRGFEPLTYAAINLRKARSRKGNEFLSGGFRRRLPNQI